MSIERIIALIAGESGTGKSFFVANLHNALVYDTDLGGGLAYADVRIARNHSERIQVGSYIEILDDLKRRQAKGQLKNILTLAIDHLSALHQESCSRHNPKDERDFGNSSVIATREWRRIREFARTQDFNLIVTAHEKAKWEDQKSVGTVADAGKNVEGDVSIALRLRKGTSYPATAWVQKWRRDPEDERGAIPGTFPFTIEAFEKLAGAGLATPREPVALASQEQVDDITNLLEVAKLPEGTVEKWFKKAGVDSFAEMDTVTVGKCITHVNDMLTKAGVKPEESKTKKKAVTSGV